MNVAKANVAVGKAAIAQAHSSVAQATAALRRAQQNLDYCTHQISRPRSHHRPAGEYRQTVVASLNGPQPLSDRQRPQAPPGLVAVNEADVGNIRPGSRSPLR